MKKEGKIQVWQDYQKEIANDHYFYVRSCIRQNFFPGSEQTFLKILRKELGKDIYENPHHTSCSGIGYHSDIVPFDTIQTIVARQFALMTESGYYNIAVSCITSFGIYNEIIETWKEYPAELEKIRLYLKKATGREFEVPHNVAHASDIVYKFKEDIAARGKFKLINRESGKPLKVVEHIGCHYSKMFPCKGVGGAEFPFVLAGMIEAWGGEVIDYPERRHCCGFGFRQYLIMSNRGYSLSNSRKKFESMEPYKPDFIVSNCPGCPMFMDRWQYVIEEMEGKTFGQNGQGIPVLTYEEMAGLVLGYNPWDMGMQMHQTNVEPLLDKMGIQYDRELKYANKEGKQIGHPTMVRFECQ